MKYGSAAKWVEGKKRMHYEVEPFGSTAYAIMGCSPSSDLYLVIIVSALWVQVGRH
ncbi:hypothetical protein FIBSPDRAFT_849079 [Athelia psychrophila]|uniref:Uncharacterized protein n=1 Tax=Athelia psychrophila TaxID=1759441 RepID=A0A166UWI0_9AGAM|nr:hypothetical protein FIBSPDRAFT_849079 [Fibularhizoctonia sp. CBS 109695]